MVLRNIRQLPRVLMVNKKWPGSTQMLCQKSRLWTTFRRLDNTTRNRVRPQRAHTRKTMPHKEISSDAALEMSVSMVREGIGSAVSSAFIMAPLWDPVVGCVGLLTLADIPYSKLQAACRKAKRHPTTQHPGGTQPVAKSRCPYVIGNGNLDFIRRVGLALGSAVFRTRKRALVTKIQVEHEFDADTNSVGPESNERSIVSLAQRKAQDGASGARASEQT